MRDELVARVTLPFQILVLLGGRRLVSICQNTPHAGPATGIHLTQGGRFARVVLAHFFGR